uniref:Inactive protein kinase SELMODRAFT_444075 n=1 Tax=Anthurium amnicola TaxID=1678845 RepID=A0A1D1Y880_9ARAE
MLKAAQRVVVIQDASREISLSAIKWALDGLSLKPGDELTLLGVLHQVNNPSTFSIPGAGKRMGYKSKVDSTSMLGASEKIISEELTRKEQEYQNSTEILQITKLYDARKVIFHKRVVVAASSPKVAAVEAVKELEATWIILDRQVKRDKKYFLERLSCGISRMKRNNIELLREPKPTQYDNLISDGRQGKAAKYEMLPGPKRGTETEIKKTTQENLEDDDLFSLELSPMSKPFGMSFVSYE